MPTIRRVIEDAHDRMRGFDRPDEGLGDITPLLPNWTLQQGWGDATGANHVWNPPPVPYGQENWDPNDSIYRSLVAHPRQSTAAHDIGRLASGIFNAVTPRTNEPEGGIPAPQGTMDYLRDTAKMFDPRTTEGIMNYAGLLAGGRGGIGGKAGHAEKEFPSILPGHTLKRVAHGEDVTSFEGYDESWIRRPINRSEWTQRYGRSPDRWQGFNKPSEGRGVPLAYNLIHDESGRRVGSLQMDVYPNSTYVGEAWIHPEYRSTPAIYDFLNIVRGTKKPVNAAVVNQKLKRILQLAARREPEQFAAFDPERRALGLAGEHPYQYDWNTEKWVKNRPDPEADPWGPDPELTLSPQDFLDTIRGSNTQYYTLGDQMTRLHDFMREQGFGPELDTIFQGSRTPMNRIDEMGRLAAQVGMTPDDINYYAPSAMMPIQLPPPEAFPSYGELANRLNEFLSHQGHDSTILNRIAIENTTPQAHARALVDYLRHSLYDPTTAQYFWNRRPS